MKIISQRDNTNLYNENINEIIENLLQMKSKLDSSIDSLELADEIDEIIEGIRNNILINNETEKKYIKYTDDFIIFNFITYSEENEYCDNIITISRNWDFIQNHIETKDCTTITKFILKDGKTIYDLYIDNKNIKKSLF